MIRWVVPIWLLAATLSSAQPQQTGQADGGWKLIVDIGNTDPTKPAKTQ